MANFYKKMENNETVVVIDHKGLDDVQALSIVDNFSGAVATRESLSGEYNSIVNAPITPGLAVEAKQLRNKLVKVRTSIAKIHKAEKAYYMAGSRFVDAVKNKLTTPVTDMEEKLKEIEQHEERKRQAALAETKAEREEKLSKYTDLIPQGIETWEEAAFEIYLDANKVEFEREELRAKVARDEAMAIEKAEFKKQEAIRLDNIELKKKLDAEREERRLEAELQAQVEAEQQAAREAEQKAITDARLAEEKITRAREAKIEQDRLDLESRLQAEKDSRDRLEHRLRMEEAAKVKAKQDAIDEENRLAQFELAKGDSQKFDDLKTYLEGAKNKFQFEAENSKELYLKVGALIDKINGYIDTQK